MSWLKSALEVEVAALSRLGESALGICRYLFWHLLPNLFTSSGLQMPQHTETSFPYDINTISKQVIQPISCNWRGCSAIINSWFTLQKVCELLPFSN